MVSVVVIGELITSVILIGHRPILTERGSDAACNVQTKGLCAKGDDAVAHRACVIASLIAHIKACHGTERCMWMTTNGPHAREVMGSPDNRLGRGVKVVLGH